VIFGAFLLGCALTAFVLALAQHHEFSDPVIKCHDCDAPIADDSTQCAACEVDVENLWRS
jgi:hypothetical protein